MACKSMHTATCIFSQSAATRDANGLSRQVVYAIILPHRQEVITTSLISLEHLTLRQPLPPCTLAGQDSQTGELRVVTVRAAQAQHVMMHTGTGHACQEGGRHSHAPKIRPVSQPSRRRRKNVRDGLRRAVPAAQYAASQRWWALKIIYVGRPNCLCTQTTKRHVVIAPAHALVEIPSCIKQAEYSRK